MKYIIIILSLTLLLACKIAVASEYQKSICSVDSKGFVFKTETKNNEKHALSIGNNRINFESTSIGKFSNDLELSNSFLYTGSKERGVFSYMGKSMKEPLKLGPIDYLCWSGLKTKYKGKVSFNENITGS